MCLLAEPDVEEMFESNELLCVGTQLPHEVYAAQGAADPGAQWNDSESGCWSTENDGSCI